MGGDLAPSLEGMEKDFADQIFECPFLGKIPILTPKISDDLFSHRPLFGFLSVFFLPLLAEI